MPLDNSKLVDKYFEMDPKTDDLLRNGSKLMEGMKVILETPEYRVNLRMEGGPIVLNYGYSITEQALRWNRWMTVSDMGWSGPDECAFIGVYEDGTKKYICVPDKLAWYVKKDSLPAPMEDDLEAEKADMQERGVPVETPGAVRISVEPTRIFPGSTSYDQMEP